VLLGCFVLTVIAVRLSSGKSSAFSLLAGFAAALLAGALLWPGNPLLRHSPLSYSPADGARYYGIGNELGGVLLGAFLFAFLGFWQGASKAARWLRWPLMAFLLALLGLSGLGANFGMTLAAVFAFWAVGLMILPTRSMRQRLWVIALAIGVIAFVSVDLTRTTSISHIGLAARQLQEPSGGQTLGLIVRKIGMNLRLLRYSMWADVMFFALGLILLAALKLGRRFEEIMLNGTGLRTAFYASLVGAGAAFVFNDSGTVAAALCLIYPAAATGYLALNRTGESISLDSRQERAE
jgi:hypothetical protein